MSNTSDSSFEFYTPMPASDPPVDDETSQETPPTDDIVPQQNPNDADDEFSDDEPTEISEALSSAVAEELPFNPNLTEERLQEISTWVESSVNVADAPREPVITEQTPSDDAVRVFASVSSVAADFPRNPDMCLDSLQEISTWVQSTANVNEVPEFTARNSTSSSSARTPDDGSVKAFSFRVKPARILKRAIEVLCDSELNDTGLAYIHVDEKGFEITVDSKGITGLLSLSASGLIDFECRRPSTGAQIVNLYTMYWGLLPVADEDTVSVYQVEGSDKLSFVFETSTLVKGLSVNFYCISNNIGKRSRIDLYCQAIVPIVDLRRMIRQWEQAAAESRLVGAIEIENNEAKFQFMDETKWNLNLGRFRLVGVRNKEPGQIYCSWFHWNFGTALYKATRLPTEFRVCFSSLPSRDVVFQFNLRELGDLLILKKTLRAHPDVDHMRTLWRRHHDSMRRSQ